MWTADSWKRPWCWERLRVEGEKGIRGWDGWIWRHQYNGHELGQTPGDGEEQGGLACYRPRGHEESDITGQLNNNKYGWWSFGLSWLGLSQMMLLWTLLCMYFSEPHMQFGWECALRWNCWLIGYAFFQFYKALLNCSTEGLYQFTFPQTLPFNKSL